jgi:hypothetical protein
MKQIKKKSFSRFNQLEAFKQLGLTNLLEWQPHSAPIEPSAFFNERLKRLKQHFDLTMSERAKELLIDAICEEALSHFPQFKIWKSASIESELATGVVDYLIAENKGFLECPLLCVVEAKKDDFMQGEAQCLVEMQACAWMNQQTNVFIDVFGIVTNGEGWKFYRLNLEKQVYATTLYSVGNMPELLGILNLLLNQCRRGN